MSAPTILVATDYSEMSQVAIDHAATQARMTGAKVLIMHAVGSPSSEQGEGMLYSGVDDLEAAERRLRATKPSADGVDIEHRLVSGEPANEILRLAKEEDVELIVMGTHGRTGVMRALVGSVAEQVLRHATCPVLTIKVPKVVA